MKIKEAISSFKWLLPGLKVKRWLLLSFIGLGLIMTGVALIAGLELDLSKYFLHVPLPLATGMTIIGFGLALLVMGFRRTIRSLVDVLMPGSDSSLLELVVQKRQLKRGPKIVVLGGGTGLGVMLRGLKEYTDNITAIVTVSDDGGSSGRLRGELGVLPPGDIRNCMLALADTEASMENLLNYRFKEGAGLKDHTVGNLLLVAMTDLAGDFNRGVQELSKVLAIRGQVLPATLSQVTLVGKMASGKIIRGESKIGNSGVAIQRISLEPKDVQPLPEALEAIAQADVVVLGPGSLYTSVIPNLLVQGIPEALMKTKAPVIYVCNVMTQQGETMGYTASQHLKSILNHGGKDLVDYMIVNTGIISREMATKYRAEGAKPVQVDQGEVTKLGVELVQTSLVNQHDLVRHDGDKLAQTIVNLAYPSINQ